MRLGYRNCDALYQQKKSDIEGNGKAVFRIFREDNWKGLFWIKKWNVHISHFHSCSLLLNYTQISLWSNLYFLLWFASSGSRWKKFFLSFKHNNGEKKVLSFIILGNMSSKFASSEEWACEEDTHLIDSNDIGQRPNCC